MVDVEQLSPATISLFEELRTHATTPSRPSPRGEADKDKNKDLRKMFMHSLFGTLSSIKPIASLQAKSHGGRIILLSFGLFTCMVLRYWGSLITAGLVVQSAVVTKGAKNIGEAATMVGMVCKLNSYNSF